jgi:predicted regulator of Ras-like GTPase activity (Roadblock/LC7/MglB family)
MSHWTAPDQASRISQVPAPNADENGVISELDATMGVLVDNVVDGVPGVLGAVIASADGFVLGSRLPEGADFDASAMAAMSAATLGLVNRLVQIGGDSPTDVCVSRSATTQVWVFAVGDSAALTIVAESGADSSRIDQIGHEMTRGLLKAFDEE